MNRNDDYPPDYPQRSPAEFPEPILDCCVIISSNVRDRQGNVQFCPNRVIQKNGQSAPFNRAGDLNDNMEKDDSSVETNSDESQNDEEHLETIPQQIEIAYLIKEVIRDAIFGKVIHGTVLKRSGENDVWTETTEECAIKEMPWEQIREGRGEQRAENPQEEIAAMQHLKRCYDNEGGQHASVTTAMRDTRIIMPLDFLYDHQKLYTITPYCTGGELFDLLAQRSRFSEEESRHFLRSILDGIEWLQRAGLTHKDISLENTMVNDDMTVIIDMGMCLRIPVDNAQRCRIKSRPRCGKLYYMAPEVYASEPFDGRAVDMWAVGVCLFMMLTGQAPWEHPTPLDIQFRYFTNGYLTRVVRDQWNMNLSADAVDLLQRMLLLDPRDRLSLQQVRNHPWMTL